MSSASTIVHYTPPRHPRVPPDEDVPVSGIYATIGAWRASAKYERLRERAPRRFWLSREECFVERAYPTAMPVREIATVLGRSVGAVRAKARQFGLRRPMRRQRAAPPPAPVDGFSRMFDDKSSTERTRYPRITWDNHTIGLVAELWKRLYSPAFIAERLGLRPGTDSMAASRAGMPSRAGLSLLSGAAGGDPLAAPEHPAVVGRMESRICPVQKTLFFRDPRNRGKQHYSIAGQQAIARRAAGSIH